MAGSTYITRSASSSVTSTTTWTMSWWFKGRTIDVQQNFFMHESGSPHNEKLDLHITSSNIFRMGWYNGSTEYNLDSSRVFRDPNAWYHMVFRYDTTQVTASDRVRLYINGVQETLTAIGGGAATYPTQDITLNLGEKNINYGAYIAASATVYSDYILSHVYYCDGQSYGPDTFGETDSTTGEWRIKDSVSVTFGDNGHYLFKNNDSVTDQSGEGNNFSLSAGTLTNSEDNPSDVFATLNPLVAANNTPIFSNGNTTLTTDTTAWACSNGSLGFAKGKFYWEVKGINNSLYMVGVAESSIKMEDANPQDLTGTTMFFNNDGGEMRKDGTSTTADYGTFNSTDVLGIACNMDDKEITIYKNGAAIVTDYALSTSIVICIPFNSINPSGSVGNFNFGNGYFGTTAISSEGTNASGIGKFEHDVPTGYTALSTKGLNI